MTETTGITISNFIAGALALGVALMIIPGIVKSSIGGATGAVNEKEFQQVYSEINGLCGSDIGQTISGEMSMGNQYEIEIDGDDMDVLKNGKSMEGWPKEFNPGNCNYVDGETTLEGTRSYKIKIVEGDEDDANQFDFVG